MSLYIYNDLVFVVDDSKCYLLDGYPSLESLGENKAEAEKKRNDNLEKRKGSWVTFINMLNEAGKLIE